MKFSWFEFVPAVGTKWPQFSMSHRVYCSCQLSPLPHRNEPISASFAPACVLSLQHASTCMHEGACLPLNCDQACFFPAVKKGMFNRRLVPPPPLRSHNLSPGVCRHFTIYHWDLIIGLNSCSLFYLSDKKTCLWGCLYGVLGYGTSN